MRKQSIPEMVIGKCMKLRNNNIYIFEHRLSRLNVGDNYVTIKFEDKMGNISSGKINIKTESIRNENM